MTRAAPVSSPAPTLASLVDEAWQQVMLDPERAGELGRQLVARARREGNVRAEAYGELHSAFHLTRTAPLAAAAAAVTRARARCEELGVPDACWLCDDMRGFLAVRRGDFTAATEIGHANESISPSVRAPQEQAITLLLLHTACHQSLRFDAALRYGYKHLALAEACGDIGQQAMALNNLSAVHLNVFNVEDALPLQQRANQIWRSLHARARLGLSINNLIAICDALELHQQAYEALQTWLNQPGGVSAEDRHHYNSRIALALLGVDRDDEAERHLAAGPYKSPVNPRTEAWWSWTKARLLNRQRRFAEARALCQGYLDTRPSRPVADAPYDIVQLFDAIRVASEALGDRLGAHAAAKQAHAACVPLVGSSVRARYISMLLQQDPELEPTAADAHGRRLFALGRGVLAYGQALQHDVAGPPSTDAVAAPVPPAPPPETPSVLQRHPFLAHVSHEMRAPLNGMLGMTSLLLLSNLDDRQRRLATLAQTSAEVLLRLVNDILDLARMESGQFRLDPQPFSLALVALEVIELHHPQADRKPIALTLTIDPALPDTRLGDALRVRQLLTNLVGNAIKFTAKGEVALTISPARSGAVRFEVRDTGKGISEAAQAQLFTEFMQEDASTAREFGGTGLGLAVSRQLVRLMHGEIGVRSRLGEGSTFWFEIVLPSA